MYRVSGHYSSLHLLVSNYSFSNNRNTQINIVSKKTKINFTKYKLDNLIIQIVICNNKHITLSNKNTKLSCLNISLRGTEIQYGAVRMTV